MQNGSLITSTRRNGEKVWEFGWRDRTSGKAVYRRIVLGTTQQFATETEARAAVASIVLEINVDDPRLQTHALTISQLAEHYRRRELSPDNTWKTYSTKKGYDHYLRRWIVPKWGECPLGKIRPIEVELWLRQLPLARSSCAKIKNIMSVLFNHARRYELFDGNPIHLVRQSAKRRTIPHILSIDEIQQLLGAVGALPRILIFIDATTGLRQSELFGLRWKDLDFDSGEINVVRSVVHGVISNCKTESSMKPIPMSPYLADMLKQWKRETRYSAPDDWVFASVRTQGKRPLWGQSLMRKNIRPVAKRLGIDKSNRLAHIPALVFNPASFPGHRHKSSAGSAQAFVSAADVGHVHAICYASKACGPRRSHSTPDCERAKHLSCTCRNTLNSWGLPAKPGSIAGGVAPFCTYGENAIDS